ncbi:MAG: hypothetical protein DRR06_20355, partial [Gammaproteobacteria bacterium]
MARLQDLTASGGNTLRRLSSGDDLTPQEREVLDRSAAARHGEFGKGLRRAMENASQTTDAFVGQMAEPFAPDFAARQFAKAAATQRNMPKGLEAKVQSFRDVDSAGSALDYGAGALGEGITSVAGIVAGGMAARLGLGTALRLGAAGKNTAQFAGGAATMLPQEAGETALTLRNNPEAMANTTPLERTGLALGKGTVASAMESIVPNLVFTKAIAGTARRIAAGGGSAAANIGRKAVAGAAGEFATEGAQELSGQVAENLATGETGYDFERALEAGVRGAITGGVLGGAGGTVQAARSNIDAAAETALEKAKPAATSAMNKAVEGLDNFIRNPEQSGADMTTATLGTLAEASARAQKLGAEVAEKAGPAAAQGMDAIAGLKGQMDEAIMGQLTPENVAKYRELTKNIRLLNPSEYEILRDAMETGDADQINEAVGAAAKLFAHRVPRETMSGIKSFAKWTKRFSAGVTNAARERRASVLRYGLSEVTDFGDYLRETQPELTNFFLSSQEPAARLESVRALMAVRDGIVSPKQMDELQEIMQTVGLSLSEVAEDIRSSAARSYVTQKRQPPRAPLTLQEEQAAYRGTSAWNRVADRAENLLVDDALIAAAERDGVDLSGPYNPDNAGYTTSVPESERGGVGDVLYDAIMRDEDNNVIEEEDRRRSPYNSLAQVRRIIGADMLTKEDGTPIVDRVTGESKVDKDA